MPLSRPLLALRPPRWTWAAALLVAALPLAAQSGARPGGAGFDGSDPSVFEPPGPAGGQFLPPGDAGAPGDDEGGGSGDSDGDGDTGGGQAQRPGRGRAEPARSGGAGGTSNSRSSRGRGATARSSLGLSGDRWDLWWETNKFDFIRLRRVQDSPVTGQGLQRETPDERELRLARTRQTIREQVLPVLRGLTASPDAQVRASAVVALAKLRDPETADLANGLLQDGALRVRRAAMLALGILDEGRAAWCLMNIADDTRAGRALLGQTSLQVDERGTALLTAALRGGRDAELVVRTLLAEPATLHPEMVAMAADAAGLMGSVRSILPLMEIAFDKDLPEYVRSSATTALGRIGEPSVTPTLLALLDDGLEPRRAAVVALGAIAHPGASRVLDRLGHMLEKETDAASRHLAAISLGRIGGDVARELLDKAFARPRPDMRPWLALGLALCERADPRGELPGVLIERMRREGSEHTLSAYAIALGLTGSEQSLESLVNLVRKGSLTVSAHATLALGLSGHRAAAPVLRELLTTHGSPFVLRQAALGLGILADVPSIPDLLEVIRTTNNPMVASFAAIGIAFMGDADAAGPLLHIIDREGATGVTTTWAVAAVGQLFDRDRRPALSRLAAGDNYLARASAVRQLLQLGF